MAPRPGARITRSRAPGTEGAARNFLGLGLGSAPSLAFAASRLLRSECVYHRRELRRQRCVHTKLAPRRPFKADTVSVQKHPVQPQHLHLSVEFFIPVLLITRDRMT